MLLEIGCILGGVPLGYALHRKPLAVRWANHALSGIIYVLLFLMGVSLGSNTDLLARVSELGLRGLCIGLFCAAGSVLVAWMLHRTLLRGIKDVAPASAQVSESASAPELPCTGAAERS